MKTILKIMSFYLIILCGLLLYSCKKDKIMKGELAEGGMAKVNVIDAVVRGGYAKVNVSPKSIYWNSLPDKPTIDGQVLGDFTLGRLFMVPADRKTVMQVVPVNDTTKMWYDNTSQLNPGKVYTLYLSGTPENVKALLHEETDFPKYIVTDVASPVLAADSTVNIRFINLSPSGPKVDVKLFGGANVTNDLGYQQFTDFKTYSATSEHEYYTFEIRKSSDNTVVATYDFPAYYYRFQSVVVFVMGIYDPDYQLPLPDSDRYGIYAIAY
ncbi:hypothetical protein ACFX5U_15610 [Sphingobacterium sp. SG20118]|uniref:hypothetical protein n=1 Tax=Sphingobacterium sp. SG20118 TaxID=3367156 RepID=UPI0037DFC627